MKKTLKQRIVEQIGASPQISQFLENHPDLKLEINHISETLVNSSLGLSSKDSRAITNEALSLIQNKRK